MTTNYLHNLSCKQLIAILKHVQCGDLHLSKKLSREEYKDLLSIGNLSNNQLQRLQSDRQEKIGNVSIVVNTILTSCFGAWLGFNGFNQTSIITPFGLLIILAAVSFGLLTGYLSYIFTHRQEKFALKNQELANVERIIIEIINNKRKCKIENLQTKIHAILFKFNLVSEHDTQPNKLLEALRRLRAPNLDNRFYALIKKSLLTIKKNVHKLMHDSTMNPDLNESFNTSDFLLNNSLTNASYIRILTKSEVVTRHQIPKVQIWLRKNLAGLAVGLLPTFLGSFASMFVFLNGFPAFFDGLHYEFGLSVREIWMIKDFSLLLALSISIYFAYSHIHSNYKSYKRAKALEFSENVIVEMTNQMLQLTFQKNNWHRILHHLELIEYFALENNTTAPNTHEISEPINIPKRASVNE